MDNPKAILKIDHKFGRAVFAQEKICKDEIVAVWDGEIYSWEDDRWNEELYDHVIQFEERKWRDSKGIARWLNHSCDPNCGIRDLFKIVAMRDIEAGEELTWDYEMTGRHIWWRMECRCGSPLWRREIGNFDNMPQNIREKYRGYISEWLLR